MKKKPVTETLDSDKLSVDDAQGGINYEPRYGSLGNVALVQVT